MEKIQYAGIDIGSNAIRLNIKNIIPGKSYNDALLIKMVNLRLPLRLGADVFRTNKIGQNKIIALIDAMKIYKKLLDFHNVTTYRACATSAMRSAENGKEVIETIKKETGIKIDVIDGIEEAILLFKTNIYNLPKGKTFLSADLGGGSLQITLFQNKTLIWSHSYKIGTVRLLSNTVKPQEFIDFDIKMKEIKEKYKDLIIIGSGGNINEISDMKNEKTLELDDIEEIEKDLNPMSILERMKKYKFRKDRADVIVPASKVYVRILKLLDKNKIFVPDIGLADGIIRELYESNHSK